METIIANESHIHQIREAFAQLRERRAMDYVDYLALPSIADFHCDRIVHAIRSSSNPITLFIEKGILAALVGIQPSAWHTNHYNIPYFKIQPLFLFTEDATTVNAVVTQMVASLCNRPDALYTTRIEAREPILPHIFGRHGFADVGVSVRLSASPQGIPYVDNSNTCTYDTFIIRNYGSRDLPFLQEIARESHRYSHFFREIRFPRERTQDLFAEWIRQCADGIAQQIFTAEQAGSVIGFSILLTSNSLSSYIQKRIGVVDFIVVDKHVQGKGIGKALLQTSMKWFQDRVDLVELRTMADNLQAIRFYEKNGFRILSVDHHFHYWT
ncbi:MAG: GNAT family N-acetyltransferase [Candidatus Omnitrophota bacterium]|jgi:ribosomal protein S18 acetylase RimI-like enzyme|nr:MAG: GNAT family N-acetyltransferase [Candidatus Omnitrophota bacterium]